VVLFKLKSSRLSNGLYNKVFGWYAIEKTALLLLSCVERYTKRNGLKGIDMKTLFKILAGLLLGVVLLIVALPFLVPVDYIVNKVSESVEKTTGRTLVIKGDKTLAVFPSLKLELNDVHFANIKGSEHADMVSMAQLAIQIPYLSALLGDIQLEKFVIRQPKIILEKMPSGKVNWQLFDAVAATTEQPTSAKGATQLPQGFDVSLGEVAIYDATISYIDHQTKAQYQLSDVELAVALPSLYQPLEVSGELVYQGQKFELVTQLNTLAKVIAGDDFTLGSAIDSKLFNFKFDGLVAKAGQDFSGSLDLKGDSVKQILTWQKIALDAKKDAFNQFELAATMHFANQKLTLTKLKLALDELDVNGQAVVDLAKKLSISADVDLGMLNLNPYLPVKPEQVVAQEDKKQVSQPIVWDDTPIDLSGINSLNANIKVRSTGLLFNEIKLDANALALNIKDGIATLDLTKFGLYEGNGIGKVLINAVKKPYQLSTDFKLTEIAAQPLLSDAAGFDKLMGKGNLAWQLTTSGVSQKQFVNGLNGTTAFSFNDGAIKGANIAALVRKAKDMLKGDLSAAKEGLNTGFDKSQQTDFSALTGSFVFKQGVGTNTDLALVSPLIRVSGSGDVNLSLTTVNYRLVTGIVDSIEGQGTTDKSTGFKVPVKIKGPFHDVKVQLDLSKAAEEETKNKLKDKVKDKLKGLFG